MSGSNTTGASLSHVTSHLNWRTSANVFGTHGSFSPRGNTSTTNYSNCRESPFVSSTRETSVCRARGLEQTTCIVSIGNGSSILPESWASDINLNGSVHILCSSSIRRVSLCDLEAAVELLAGSGGCRNPVCPTVVHSCGFSCSGDKLRVRSQEVKL